MKSWTSEEKSKQMSRRRRALKLIVIPGADVESTGEEFAVDEADYCVISDMVLTSGNPSISTEEHVLNLVGFKKDDEERRISKLRYTLLFPHVTNYQMVTTCIQKLKDLTSLTRLDLGNSDLLRLPPTIGQLKNLEELDLSFTIELSAISEEIGELANLRKLKLNCSGIGFRSIPSSIGKLKNLKELNLSYTENLTKLPDEIGDLESLQKLDLEDSGITSLPPSIGRLQNLEDLQLQWTEKLTSLPDEIGDLISLKSLDLRHSEVRSLPPSIGGLQNLQVLDMGFTTKLNTLPEEIGHLSKLKILGLSHSGITLVPLPEFLGNLKELLQLDLFRHMVYHRDCEFCNLLRLQKYSLLMLTQRCKLLGSLCLSTHSDLMGFHSPLVGRVRYALACNRARCRTKLGIKQFDPNMWPLVLHSAIRAFGNYNFDGNDSIRTSEYPCEEKNYISQADAIYQLLVDGRESFVRVIVHRQRKAVWIGNNGV